MRSCVTARALAGILLGSLLLASATSQAQSAQSVAYALVPTAPTSSTPSPLPAAQHYNGTNAAATVQRLGVGSYALTFPGLDWTPGGAAQGSGGHFQISPVSAGTEVPLCVASWDSSSAPARTLVEIRCTALATGAPMDSGFSVLGWRRIPNTGYVWTSEISPPVVAPSYSYVASGTTPTVTRSSTGVYTARFPGLLPDGSTDLGYPMVSSYDPNKSCRVVGWDGTTNPSMNIRCDARDGTPTDTRVLAAFLRRSFLSPGEAYAWAEWPTAPRPYTPTPVYMHSLAGDITIQRLDTGRYTVILANGSSSNGHLGAVHVNVRGFYDAVCYPTGMFTTSGPLAISVRCVTYTGAPVDAQFIFYRMMERYQPVADEPGAETSRLALGAPAPHPVTGTSRLSLTLPAPADARVAVVDVRGREVALLHAGPLPAGTTALTVDASGLAPGVYVVRAVAGRDVAVRRLVVVR